jgi:hypothetical protein
MYGTEQVLTSRETSGIQIPDGTPVTVPAGTSVRVAQALGDTYTLVLPWGAMVRIEARDADAIGKEPPPHARRTRTASQSGSGRSCVPATTPRSRSTSSTSASSTTARSRVRRGAPGRRA